jgi:hypothetical protein
MRTEVSQHTPTNAELEYLQDHMNVFAEQEAYFFTGPTVGGDLHLSWYHRKAVMAWVLEVCVTYSNTNEELRWPEKRHAFFPDMFFLAVSIFDRMFTSCLLNGAYSKLTEKNIQLIGGCSLMIASKMEGCTCFHPPEIFMLCDSLYSLDFVKSTERDIMKMLGYRVPTASNPGNYIRIIDLKERLMPKEVSTLTYFLCLFILGSPESQKTKPSIMSAAAMALSLKISGRPWTGDLVFGTGYKGDDHRLAPVMREMVRCASEAPGDPHLQVVVSFFGEKGERFNSVSKKVGTTVEMGAKSVLAAYLPSRISGMAAMECYT